MNERENGETPAVQRVLSENGKTCFYLHVKNPPLEHSRSAPTPWLNDEQKLRKLIQLAEPIQGQLRFSEENVEKPTGTNDNQHAFGEHMVVRNAREMFENVDILTDGRYFCRVCNRTYKTHATLTAHLRGCHLRQESPCGEKGCNYVSYTENERKKHQKIHDKKKAKDYMIKHQEMKRPVIQIPIPSEEVLREQILRNNKDIAGMNKSIVTDESGRSKVKYTCTECKQSFFNSYHASRHSEVHRNVPKRCYYCGEIRRGIMDLRVHYLRTHKNEGIRTFTCCACNGGYTSLICLKKHADQRECQLALQSSGIRQDIYYGELPAGVTIDQKTLNRLNFFRKRQDEREAQEQMPEADIETVQLTAEEARTAVPEIDLDIFDGSNSLIQTEFGLKSLADYKMSAQFRPGKRAIDSQSNEDIDGMVNAKRDRVLMAQNGYHEHPESQSQQQNMMAQYPMDFVQAPPSYGYDPLIDFQPMQQAHQYSYQNYDAAVHFPAYSEQDYTQQQDDCFYQMNKEANEDDTIEYFSMPDSFMRANEMVNELLVGDGHRDAVFEELDKLNFAMPPSDENECDDDLVDLFNF